MTKKPIKFNYRTSLCESIFQSLILCYEEDVSELTASLALENLNPCVLRASYSSEELTFSRNTRTFIGHATAWRAAAKLEGYSLICEADFVPCLGIGSLPVFWPVHDRLAWGYLYQGSPRLLSVIESG